MAIARNLLAGTFNDSNLSSYVTASITPSANALVLIAIVSRLTSANQPTVTGCGLTWVVVKTQTYISTGSRVTVLRAMGASPSAGALTIDFAGQAQNCCHWHVVEFTGVDTSGTNGSGAIVQSPSTSVTGATSIAVTMANFADSVNNAAYGVAALSGAATIAIDASGGWAELYETIGAAPATEAQSQWKTGQDLSVSASWTGSMDAGAIAIEIKAASGTTHSADAALDVAATVSPAAGFAQAIAAALAAVGTVSPVPRVTLAGATALQAAVTVNPAPRATYAGAAALAEVSSLAGAPRLTAAAAAVLQEITSVNPGAGFAAAVAALLQEITSVAAQATTLLPAASAISVTVTIAPTVSLTRGAVSALPMVASISPAAIASYSAAAALAEVTTINPAPRVTLPAAAALDVSAIVAALLAGLKPANAALAEVTSIAPLAFLTIGAAAVLAEVTTITPAAGQARGAAAAVSVSVTLSPKAGFRISAATALAALATISPSMWSRLGAAVVLAATATIAPTAFVPLQPSLRGQAFWVVVYAIDGVTALGAILRISHASTHREVNQLGRFEFTMSAIDPAASLLLEGRQVNLYYEGHGIRFRGIIEGIEENVQDDNPLLKVSGLSLGAELIYANSYLGIPAIGATPSATLTAILAAVSGTWTQTVTGSYANTVTSRFDNMTLFAAALKLAEIAGGYIRGTNTARNLEMKNTYTDSGIVVSNLEAQDISASASPKVATIRGLPKVLRDGTGIFNSIVPYGRATSASRGSPVDLLDSSRGSPYTIETANPVRPSITAQSELHGFGGSGAGRITSSAPVEIVAYGPNRAIAVFIHCADTNAEASIIDFVMLDGREMRQETHQTGGLNGELYCFTMNGVAEGAHSIVITTSPVTDFDFTFWAIALQDVYQGGVDIVRGAAAFSSTPGTSASTTETSSNIGDLAIDMLVLSAPRTATPGAGQTNFPPDETSSPPLQYWQSYKDGASSVTMTWSWTTTAFYDQLIFSFRGQPIYYIEDATSIAAYRRRTKILDLDVPVFSGKQLTGIANSLYDQAVDFLTKHKDPVTFYQVDVVGLPATLDDALLPGDSVRLLYKGLVNEAGTRRTWKSVDATLPVLAIDETWEEDGPRQWRLTVGTALRPTPSPNNAVGAIIGDVGSLTSVRSMA